MAENFANVITGKAWNQKVKTVYDAYEGWSDDLKRARRFAFKFSIMVEDLDENFYRNGSKQC